MFYLYCNHDLIACSTTFSEIAEIFIVELLGISKDSHYEFNIAYQLFLEWYDAERCGEHKHAQLKAFEPDGLFEVWYG